MDDQQHYTQDAAEAYAVFTMAISAQEMGILGKQNPGELREKFRSFLRALHWDESDFIKHYPQYKSNVDSQIPKFIGRLAELQEGSRYTFELDEVNQRNAGKKADFIVSPEDDREDLMVSLKNYIGQGGITRPQVSSGTFLSFANGFIFERNGVGTYSMPGKPNQTFKGSNKAQRDIALTHLGYSSLVARLDTLVELQQKVRNDLLTVKFYDPAEVRRVIEAIVPTAQRVLLEIFEIIGAETVKKKFLERANLDGSEHILYFDSLHSIDSITSEKFAKLYQNLNSENTILDVESRGQSIHFDFKAEGDTVLKTQVPLTINTNGAWYRPKEKFDGTQIKKDGNKLIELRYGEIRPKKSKEISTSTNLYLDLVSSGIFDE